MRMFDIKAQSIGEMVEKLKPFICDDYWVEWTYGVISEIEAISTDGRYYYPAVEVTDLKTGKKGYIALSENIAADKYNAWGATVLAQHVIDRARGNA